MKYLGFEFVSKESCEGCSYHENITLSPNQTLEEWIKDMREQVQTNPKLAFVTTIQINQITPVNTEKGPCLNIKYDRHLDLDLLDEETLNKMKAFHKVNV